MPNGDVILPDGTVLSGDGTGPISYALNGVYQKSGSTASWASGDPAALKALLANQNPDTVNYDTQGFDPTATPNLNLGYGIDSNAVNAEIAKSPIMTAELNEALAHGVSIQFTLDGGEYDDQNNLITIPASQAGSPDQIVVSLAHELGHAMWGDVDIPASQALGMSDQQFVDNQVSLELRGEGVATINNIAVSEQIWGAGDTTLKNYVAGVGANGALAKFGSDYALYSGGSDTLEQAASDIGSFYAINEFPHNDPSENYQASYTRAAQTNYGIYSANAASHAEYQKLQQWRQQLISGQRSDMMKFKQALHAYETSAGGGQ